MIHFRSFLVAGAVALPTLCAGELVLSPLSSIRNGDPVDLFDESAAEIVKFDPVTQRMFVVNGASDSVDIFDASNPESPSLISSIDVSAIGNPNSVDVNPNRRSNEIAVAVGSPSNDQRGWVVFYDTDGNELERVEVGYLPDMLTYDERGLRVVVANEGEPTDDYGFDPEGSVSVIDLRGWRRVHTEITLDGLDGDDVAGVRITGPEGTTIAQDLEPEYVAIEGNTAFVTCQENNAVLRINIRRKLVEAVLPLGSVDHSKLGNALDVSDKDDMIRIANWPVNGLFMPDAIAAYSVRPANPWGRGRGETYFVTANEGDAREWGDYIDEERIEDLVLDPSAFPLAAELQKEENLGRLDAVTTEGDVDGDGDYDQLFCFGTRSFSIFSADGELVFNSGSMIEEYLAENYPDDFNCAHDESGSFDSRSDAKGAEPEAIELGSIDGRTYAFVGLERFSAIIVFDITDPHAVTQAGFGINRDFSVAFDEENLDDVGLAGDLGPEGLDFVPAASSPNGAPLLIVANEVSGTTTIYEISERIAP